jgi:hypothetical protein
MAYGGKNTRSSIADQIAAEIESDMTSSVSETKGRGFSLGQRITSDTQSEVDKLKSDVDKGSKTGVIRKRKDKEEDSPNLASDLIGFAKNWISGLRSESEDNNPTSKSEPTKVAYNKEIDVNPKVVSGELEEESSANSFFNRPTSKKDFSKQVAGLVKKSGDDEFPEAVEMFAEKFDITANEVYAVINGENKDWAYNKTNKGGYKGLFQIGKTAAKEAGIDYGSIANKSPTEQLALYDTYLTRWNYDSSIPLGLYQAAPGLASNLKDQSDDTIIYAKGSPAWKKNKGWRSADNGAITKGSIISYYQ